MDYLTGNTSESLINIFQYFKLQHFSKYIYSVNQKIS